MGIIGEHRTRSPLRSVRRWRPNTFKNKEPRCHPKGETQLGGAGPPPVRSFRPTDIPSFEPSIPPPGRRDRVREQTAPQPLALAERESNRPRLRPPETFPRSARQIRKDRRSEERKTGLIQTWTTAVYGLEEDDET